MKEHKEHKVKSHMCGYPEGFRAGRRKKVRGKLECTVCGKDIKDFFFYYSYIRVNRPFKRIVTFATYSNIIAGQPGLKFNSSDEKAEIACGKACAELICFRIDYYKGNIYKNEAYNNIYARQ